MADQKSGFSSVLEALPVVGGIASSIANIGQGKKNRRAAAEMNQKNIDAQQRLNEENRAWSRKQWEDTNEYNSPLMTMARYKEAGLNPHLIYGQPSNVSQPATPSTSAPHAEVEPPVNYSEGIFKGMQTYVAMRQQQSEIDNQAKARDVMDADIIAKNAASAAALSNSAKTDQDRDFASKLFATTSAQAVANLNSTNLAQDKTKQEISNLVQSNIESGQRVKLSQAQIANLASEITFRGKQAQLLRLQGENLKADNELKQLDINLRKVGVNPSDPSWQRILIQNAGSLFSDGPIKDIGDAWKYLKAGVKTLWNHQK